MLELEPEIITEYQRVVSKIADIDELPSADFLTIGVVLKAHFLIANPYGQKTKTAGKAGSYPNPGVVSPLVVRGCRL